MATMTTHRRLAEIRRHIEELQTRARSGGAETRTRLQTKLDTLREEEAAARAAAHEKAEAVDDQVRQLEINMAIAGNRLASEMADDETSFAHAVNAELHNWDAAIERLQTRAAAKAPNVRAQAEREIAELRQARNRAAERLAELHTSSDEAWEEQKNRVTAELDALERKVRAGTAKFH